MNNNRNFLANVISEMKKVHWPTGQEVVKYTILVAIAVVFFLAFFYAIDLAITFVIELI